MSPLGDHHLLDDRHPFARLERHLGDVPQLVELRAHPRDGRIGDHDARGPGIAHGERPVLERLPLHVAGEHPTEAPLHGPHGTVARLVDRPDLDRRAGHESFGGIEVVAGTTPQVGVIHRDGDGDRQRGRIRRGIRGSSARHRRDDKPHADRAAASHRIASTKREHAWCIHPWTPARFDTRKRARRRGLGVLVYALRSGRRGDPADVLVDQRGRPLKPRFSLAKPAGKTGPRAPANPRIARLAGGRGGRENLRRWRRPPRAAPASPRQHSWVTTSCRRGDRGFPGAA